MSVTDIRHENGKQKASTKRVGVCQYNEGTHKCLRLINSVLVSLNAAKGNKQKILII